MFDLDNYRIFLTSLVILHQAALAYGGSGAWAVVEGATDSVTPLILSTFNTVNQSCFVSAVKFVLTGTVTIAICFLIATLLRAIPGTRPVLGKGGNEGGGSTRTLTLPDRARYGLLP